MGVIVAVIAGLLLIGAVLFGVLRGNQSHPKPRERDETGAPKSS